MKTSVSGDPAITFKENCICPGL